MTMNYFSEVSVKQAQDQLLVEDSTLILDVRDAYSYKADHIEGAMQAHGGLVEHLIQSKQYDRPILVYCYYGNSSKELAEVFGRAGFKKCFSLKGGFTAWKKRDSLYAAGFYNEQTNLWLVEKGFEEQSLDAVIDGQKTPLMSACEEAKLDIVRELINAGADLEIRNSDGNTAIWAACFGGNLDIIKLLIDAGANIDHCNNEGVTALIYAASAGKTDVVKLLVEEGADVELKTADDFTALDLAANMQILKLLKKQTALAAV